MHLSEDLLMNRQPFSAHSYKYYTAGVRFPISNVKLVSAEMLR